MSDYLTAEQVAVLLRPIKAGRVSQDRDGMSHLQAYDVRAHLNRVFGFGRWSADVLDVTPLFDTPTETKAKKPAFYVGYRATVRLTVHSPDGTVLATYTECATGGNVMPDFKRADGHDFAIKTAESQALKRCAMNLGDQFGLSLYAQGSLDAVVGQTLVNPDAATEAEDVEPDAVVPETAEEPTEPGPEPASEPGLVTADLLAVVKELGLDAKDVAGRFAEWHAKHLTVAQAAKDDPNSVRGFTERLANSEITVGAG